MNAQKKKGKNIKKTDEPNHNAKRNLFPWRLLLYIEIKKKFVKILLNNTNALQGIAAGRNIR